MLPSWLFVHGVHLTCWDSLLWALKHAPAGPRYQEKNQSISSCRVSLSFFLPPAFSNPHPRANFSFCLVSFAPLFLGSCNENISDPKTPQASWLGPGHIILPFDPWAWALHPLTRQLQHTGKACYPLLSSCPPSLHSCSEIYRQLSHWKS